MKYANRVVMSTKYCKSLNDRFAIDRGNDDYSM